MVLFSLIKSKRIPLNVIERSSRRYVHAKPPPRNDDNGCFWIVAICIATLPWYLHLSKRNTR